MDCEGSNSCQLLDYGSNRIPIDSLVAFVGDFAEVEQKSYYLDDSLNKLCIVHYQIIFGLNMLIISCSFEQYKVSQLLLNMQIFGLLF